MSTKKGIGVNVKWGTELKRIFFAVTENPETQVKFNQLCEQINSFNEVVDFAHLLHLVIELFQHHGFEWIPK